MRQTAAAPKDPASCERPRGVDPGAFLRFGPCGLWASANVNCGWGREAGEPVAGAKTRQWRLVLRMGRKDATDDRRARNPRSPTQPQLTLAGATQGPRT